MGGSESRTLTVASTEQDSVKISQGVYNRLAEAQRQIQSAQGKEAATNGEQGLLKSQQGLGGVTLSGEALVRIEEEYARRLREYEKRSEVDLQRAEQHFEKTAAQIESKFPDLALKNACWNELAATNDCYTKQPKQILNCSRLVNEFVNCVESAKQKAAVDLRPAEVKANASS